MPAAAPGAVETGAPAFVVLGPEAMGLSTVPTDLQVLPDGRILVVAQREIAFGDGLRWEVFRAAEGESALSPLVAVDADGQIYTGTEGGIARVDLGDDARWHLTLVVELRRDLGLRNANLTSVASIGGTWYWNSGNGAVVSWRPGQPARVAASGSSIERIFGWNQNAFFSEGSSGTLFELNGTGTAERVFDPGDVSETVASAVPFGDGRMLLGTVSAGMKIFEGKTFQPFAPVGLLSAGRRIADLCTVGDGLFAAAVDSIGVVFFDREGHTVQTLERALDHRLARVQRLRYAPDGVLWVLLGEGVARVEHPSPFSDFAPLLTSGLGFAQPVRHAGKLWMLSEGQAMRGVYDASGRLERFQEDTPPGKFLFTLADAGGQLFASNEAGVFAYENGGWTLVLPGIVNARLGFSPPTSQGVPYVARGEYGFIERTTDAAVSYAAHRFTVPGLGDNYNAVADGSGIVWIELGASRIGRFDLRSAPAAFTVFDSTAGLTPGWAEIYVLGGVARFQLSAAHLLFDDTTRRFVPDDRLRRDFPPLQTLQGRPLVDSFGRLWHTADGQAHVTARGSITPQTIPGSFSPMEYVVEESGVAWLFGNRRLARLDLRVQPPPPRRLRALITSVQFAATNRWLFRPAAALGSVSYADNSLVIHFAAPANPFESPVTFEVMLEGAGTSWVSTGGVGSATFTRLKEGRYAFRVRPVAGAGKPGEEARLEFEVRPPWFRTPLAWTAYGLAAVSLFAFAAWLSAFLQRRENERLERLVTERTEELSRQIVETTEKSAALSSSEERYRTLNTELEARVQQRTAELSLSNAELQQRESLFRLIFEHAPVGISWKRTDLGGNYHVNATFRRILALSGNFTDASPLASLIHPEDAALQARFNAQVQSGKSDSYNVEVRFVLQDRRVVWGSLSVAVVRDDRGRIVQDIGILEEITARKQAEEELAKTYKDLVGASRLAGMAEVATGVLHNVGNVLNSLNVSSNLVTETVQRSNVEGLVKLAALVNEHAGDLGAFLTHDPKGKLVPGYLANLAEHSTKEREALLQEVCSMQKNIDHIKEIVAMQQSHATAAGVIETLEAAELFEDALRMNSADLAQNDIRIVREFSSVPPLSVEKGKVLQILVNLIRNAKHACDDVQKHTAREKTITLRIEANGEDKVRLIVRDNGIGIPPENLTRIFVHGFTTRTYGHGFGLHSSALAAKEMKGSLSASSEGKQQGATFFLELPIVVERMAGEIPRRSGLVSASA
jgi:PAS domain S-box-containing protein